MPHHFSIQLRLTLTLIIAIHIVSRNLNLGMYTNDKMYGLQILPKRPWEKFKDPENTIKRVAVRHNRDNPEF
jgi:hypothetical protein